MADWLCLCLWAVHGSLLSAYGPLLWPCMKYAFYGSSAAEAGGQMDGCLIRDHTSWDWMLVLVLLRNLQILPTTIHQLKGQMPFWNDFATSHNGRVLPSFQKEGFQCALTLYFQLEMYLHVCECGTSALVKYKTENHLGRGCCFCGCRLGIIDFLCPAIFLLAFIHCSFLLVLKFSYLFYEFIYQRIDVIWF